MALAAHSRCTVALDTPVALAIERTDQRVRPGGGWVARLTIAAWVSSATLGLRPRPWASARPARPAAPKRRSQSTTTGRLTPTRRAVSAWLKPSARSRMICARRTSRRVAVGRCTSRCNAPRCSAVIGKGRTGRAMHCTIRHLALYVQRFVRHYTRPSKPHRPQPSQMRTQPQGRHGQNVGTSSARPTPGTS